MVLASAAAVVREGVLLLAHGTIEDLAELPEFLLRIRRGRPPPPELVAELRRRYERIGRSPLLDITREQARALGAELGLPVFVGMRLWKPSVEEALRAAATSGVARLAVVPLAPFSVQVYHDAALRSLRAVAQELSVQPELVAVEPWGSEPLFVEATAQRIRGMLARFPHAKLVLTAHSLPLSVIRAGDRYASEVESAARALGHALGVPYVLAYQSQGAEEGEWLGPDLGAELRSLRASGENAVLVAPFGFLAEHVETLFDLDVEASAHARGLGLELHRVPALNADPHLIGALAAVARRSLSSAPPPSGLPTS